jgi:alpha-methylacyl-CoA racemase
VGDATDTGAGGPLEGLKVLDLTRFLPGGFGTLLLADLGADVIKVEAPGMGDGVRTIVRDGVASSHLALNRGKRSVALDLRKEGSAEVLDRLVGWADVVVEAHKPGQLDRLGIGYEAMSAKYPALVWCSLTGFGDFGPNAAYAGHDVTYLGVSGLLGRLADGPPSLPLATVSLPIAATMAVVGILAAVHQATRTGRGTRLDANMTDAAMWSLSEEVAQAAQSPAPPWPANAARTCYLCADGRYVTVAAGEPRTWAALCEALQVPDLAEHRFGKGDDAAAQARLSEVFATRPAAEWVSNPGLLGGVGAVNEVEDLLDDPQVTGRDSLVAIPGTQARVLANPIRFMGEAGTDASHGLRPPPDLGGDTDAVLTALGLEPSAIEDLRSTGVIA